MVERSDEDLARAVLAGDMRAFEALVNRHQDTVARFVYRLVPNEADRDEVCQDVFVTIYKKLYQYRFDARFTTWLYRIAYNTAVSSKRRRKIVAEEVTDDIESADDLQVQQESLGVALEQHIQRLKLEERTVVTLYYLQDCSIEEISAIVEKPAGTVKNLLYRARQKLYDSIERLTPDLAGELT